MIWNDEIFVEDFFFSVHLRRKIRNIGEKIFEDFTGDFLIITKIDFTDYLKRENKQSTKEDPTYAYSFCNFPQIILFKLISG